MDVARAPFPRHVCWSYDDAGARAAYAQSYLGDGLAAGEQVWYAAAGGQDGMAEWIAAASKTGPDAVRFVPLESAYRTDDVVDPDAQVAVYAAATDAALAAGFTGLRVFAEVTPLVRSPEQLDAFARYEALADLHMAVAPMRAVCAFDRSRLGERPIAELACLHPATNADGVLFALTADADHGPGSTLTGELDLSMNDLFPTALDHASPRPVGGEIRLEATGLRFVDHRALLHLQDYGERTDVTVVLRTRLRSAASLAGLLDLSRVRVEVVA